LRVLELYKTREGIKRDAEAARRLGLRRSDLSSYKTGYSSPDTYACVRLALAAGHDPMTLIAAVCAEKETKAERAAFWRDFFRRVTQHGSIPVLIFGAICLIGQPECGGEGKTLTKQSIIRIRQLRAWVRGWMANLTHETKWQCY